MKIKNSLKKVMDKLKILPILYILITLCSCSSSDEGDQPIIPSTDDIIFMATGGTQEIEIGQGWTLDVSNPDVWCSAEVIGSKLILTALSNSGSESRQMKFHLSKSNSRREVNVLQYPVAKVNIGEKPGSFPKDGGQFDLSIESNIPFSKVSVSDDGKDWLTCVISRSVTLHITISPNNGEKSRTATITLEDDKGNIIYSFTITQKGNQPFNTIYYTTTGGSLISVNSNSFGGNVQILSHTYLDGEGEIVFSGNILAINYNAFYDQSSLLTVSLPESVCGIGERAFKNCWNLKEINIPENVKSIGEEAFINCNSLKSITVPYDCELGRKVFAFSGLEHFSFPEMEYIPYSTFLNCTKLKSVQLPEGLKTIGESAFKGCTMLQSVSIPSSLTDVYVDAFKDCKSLENLSFGREVAFERCFDGAEGSISFYPSAGEYGLSLLGGFKGTYICPEDVTPERLIGNRAYLTPELRFGGKYASEDGRCLIIDGDLYIANLYDYSDTQYEFPKGIKKVVDRSIKLHGWDNGYKNVVFFFFAEGLEEMGWDAFMTFDENHSYSQSTYPVINFPKSFKKFTGNIPINFNIGCYAIFNSEIPPELDNYDIFQFDVAANVILVPENAVETYKLAWPQHSRIIRQGSIDDFVHWDGPNQ